MTDPLGALRTWILDQPAVRALSGARVYVGVLPADDAVIPLMPVKAVVLRESGGREELGSLQVHAISFEAVSFGETDAEAAALDLALASALRGLERRVVDGVLLHNATMAAGASQGREPETLWPLRRRPGTLRADERSP